jgi:hypothetical protein
MKATELIQLFEYGKAFSKPNNKQRKIKKLKREMTLKDYLKYEAEIDQFLKYKKEKEDEAKKIAKSKEVKKEGISASHMAMFLVASFPITAPLYVYGVKMLLEAMK